MSRKPFADTKFVAKVLTRLGNAFFHCSDVTPCRQELVQEAAAIREQARKELSDLSLGSSLPRTNAEWLEWLESNEDHFRSQLRTATQSRKTLSHRRSGLAF